MLFRHATLAAIADGSVTLAFRRWKRPTVRSGGTLLTPFGELEIAAVRRVERASITAADARHAGHVSREELLAELDRRDGEIYRIELGALRPDPRAALREKTPTAAELSEIEAKLERLDARAPDGPWTRRALELIAAHPEVRAGDLCRRLDQDRPTFKRNVRKLKTLGLTKSLRTGYRLSPHGQVVLAAVRKKSR